MNTEESSRVWKYWFGARTWSIPIRGDCFTTVGSYILPLQTTNFLAKPLLSSWHCSTFIDKWPRICSTKNVYVIFERAIFDKYVSFMCYSSCQSLSAYTNVNVYPQRVLVCFILTLLRFTLQHVMWYVIFHPFLLLGCIRWFVSMS